MEEKQCKGLIIQNNPFSTKTGNGKTIASMFSKWNKENIAQIYVSNLEPDYDICEKYYQISDREVLTSFFSKTEIGSVKEKNDTVDKQDIGEQEAGQQSLMNNLMSGSSFVAVLRDYIWQKSNWNNEKFNDWLDMVKPDFVFLSAGNMAVFFEMAQYVVQKYNIPLFIHIGDDYYIYRSGKSPWKNLQRKRMSESLSQAVEISSGIIAICDKMARVFQKRYGGEYLVCMNSVDMQKTYYPIEKKDSEQVLKLVYAGNLGINRWKVLCLVGEALQELEEEGLHAELCIYSSYMPTTPMLKKLNRPPVIKFCGSVFGEELYKIKEDADILVHVESFDKKYRQLTYTAMSTKISEYLSSGRVILGVGPKDAASIEFLEENKVALVVDTESKELIKQQVRHYWENFEQFKAMTERAKKLAEARFSKEENSIKIYKMINGRCQSVKNG